MAQAKTDQKLLTLTEVAKKTGISMPTLQRYKQRHQDRIPSVGKGRKQRYPTEALSVFEQLKQENISRRGRPRKAAASSRGRKSKRGKARRPAASAAGSDQKLLTLTEVEKKTGISYPTLSRYVKLHPGQIPHEGKGRRRRYYPEAVEVFRKLRSESRRGRRPGKPAAKGRRVATGPVGGADVIARLKGLEQAQSLIVKELGKLRKELNKPLKVSFHR